MPTEPIKLTWVHITSLRAMSYLHGKGQLRVTSDDIAGVWREFDHETELPDGLGTDLHALSRTTYIDENSKFIGSTGLVERTYRLHDGVVTNHEVSAVKYCDLCSSLDGDHIPARLCRARTSPTPVVVGRR